MKATIQPGITRMPPPNTSASLSLLTGVSPTKKMELSARGWWVYLHSFLFPDNSVKRWLSEGALGELFVQLHPPSSFKTFKQHLLPWRVAGVLAQDPIKGCYLLTAQSRKPHFYYGGGETHLFLVRNPTFWEVSISLTPGDGLCKNSLSLAVLGLQPLVW